MSIFVAMFVFTSSSFLMLLECICLGFNTNTVPVIISIGRVGVSSWVCFVHLATNRDPIGVGFGQLTQHSNPLSAPQDGLGVVVIFRHLANGIRSASFEILRAKSEINVQWAHAPLPKMARDCVAILLHTWGGGGWPREGTSWHVFSTSQTPHLDG